jgi:hypothetical protein
MRGVGIVPPYTPKAPQPMLSTRMNTTLGFFSCACAGRTAKIVAPITLVTRSLAKDVMLSSSLLCGSSRSKGPTFSSSFRSKIKKGNVVDVWVWRAPCKGGAFQWVQSTAAW